ncbi:MAG: hypothetical protein JRG76_02650 [Deltaproteobacteria bacterium]|nr:hypothetical protein [Deltaproteobacteria bacterium]MBW2413388.1 hypothetical protein [Deltaproteobacteria bacterium]
MIEKLTLWEVALVGALLVLNGTEVAALAVARWKGRTTNVSRLLVHGSVLVCALVYAWLSIGFGDSLAAVDYGNLANMPASNWPYIVLLGAIGVMVGHELISHLRAIRSGLTRNVSRVATRVAMLILLVVMVGLSELRWMIYLENLETLSHSPAAAADTVHPTQGAWVKPPAR